MNSSDSNTNMMDQSRVMTGEIKLCIVSITIKCLSSKAKLDPAISSFNPVWPLVLYK